MLQKSMPWLVLSYGLFILAFAIYTDLANRNLRDKVGYLEAEIRVLEKSHNTLDHVVNVGNRNQINRNTANLKVCEAILETQTLLGAKEVK